IWSNRYESAAWGMAELISTNDPRFADIPDVAMNSQGTALAVWEQFSSAVTLWSNRLGGSWQIPQLLASEPAASPSPPTGPQVALDENGNGVAVWFDMGTTVDTVWANRFSAGAWGQRRQIGNDGPATAIWPKVGIDARGN